jgi:hypothetical protein
MVEVGAGASLPRMTREVIVDPNARYFEAKLDEQAL